MSYYMGDDYMRSELRAIAESIRANDKRMAKIRAQKTTQDMRKVARGYVIAESAAQKVRMTENDASEVVCAVVGHAYDYWM